MTQLRRLGVTVAFVASVLAAPQSGLNSRGRHATSAGDQRATTARRGMAHRESVSGQSSGH